MLFPRSVRALAPLGLGFLLLLASAAGAIVLSMRQETAVNWVRHTLEAENRINLVRSLITEAESGHRGYLLTGQDEYLAPFRSATERLPRELAALDKATIDNPIQQRNMERLRPALQSRLETLGAGVTLARLGRTDAARQVLLSGEGRTRMVEVRALLGQMIAEEDRLLSTRAANVGWITVASRGALLASALLVILLAFVAVRDGRRRIAEIELTNERLREEIAERQFAQSQIRQLQKMEAVGQLTGGIAHDFNNMLAIIIGSLDMARRKFTGPQDSGLLRYLDNALEGADRAAKLTSRLLAFSRQQPLEPRVTEVNNLVAGMSELLRRTLGERVQIETVLGGGLWRIHADVAQLESALVNLSVNARDAMPDGGKLTLETSNAELDERYARNHEEVSAGQYVMISITDTGTGMSPEQVERAIEPFFTTKEVGRGTGLGLSQTFGFVKQSSGHMKIYSELGRGTTVKLYLRRYLGDEQEAAEETAGDVIGGSAEELILVVEDDDKVRHMSVDALRDLGYTVIHASDASKALEQIALNPGIDLLFTDIVMPGLTGRQLADRVAVDWPEVKVLYTTGYTRNAIVHNGVVDYGVNLLVKPFSIDDLARKVRSVLDGSAH